MSRIFSNTTQLIGNTPLLSLDRFVREKNLPVRLLAKLECFNPAGSIKDRAALYMIEQAEQRGTLRPGMTIIEPTSGNTGIGLASIAVSKGYRVILTMPETMSLERRALLAAYGAQLVLTEGALGMKGAIAKAEALCLSEPEAWMPMQFANADNARAHYETTGPEIWADTDGALDFFVAGVGTGGTITGAGRFLKEKKPSLYVVAVEPDASSVLSGGAAGPHPLQGIGAGFVPPLLDTSIFDEVVTVTGAQAFEACRQLTATEGLLTGISSGAALAAAVTLAGRPEHKDKTIAVVLPDTGERYLSSPVYAQT